MDGNMDSGLVSRLEVVETGRRRRWSDAEKLRIVAESMAGPRLVSATARRHGISRWHLNTWRRQVREGRLFGDTPIDGASAFAALANDGQDTHSIQLYMGHRNIQNPTVYTQLSAGRFKGFWKD